MSLPPPSTLSPSKVSSFVSCPLAFRYSYIDHLPETSSPAQVRGTLIHKALQLLFDEDTPDRTEAFARAALERAASELSNAGEFDDLGLDEEGLQRFVHQSATLLERYFALEDPNEVHPIGLELDLRATLEGVELHGIIDRLDHLPDGEFVVVDYKTGRSPAPDRARSRLGGVQFYAYLCEQALGRRPREIRLMYLADRVVIVESPTDQTMRGLRQRAIAVWNAIERACETEDFRPNPSALCKFCSFQQYCPSFGGTIPERSIPAAVAS